MTTAATIADLEESLESMERADYQMAQHLVEDVIAKLKAAPIQIVEAQPHYNQNGTVAHCNRPPAGWYCTRGFGHEGLCAAVPTAVSGCQNEFGTCTVYCGQCPPKA